MKTILKALTIIILFLIPTVNFAQVNDLGIIADNVSSNVILEGINVYPNPTIGNITIQFNSEVADNYIVNVIDITGKLVFSDKIAATEGINLYEINLSKEVKGIYLLILENSAVKEQKRFIVQ